MNIYIYCPSSFPLENGHAFAWLYRAHFFLGLDPIGNFFVEIIIYYVQGNIQKDIKKDINIYLLIF